MDEKDVLHLLSRLTLEEKIGQTNMLGGSIYSDFSPAAQNDLLIKGQIGSLMYFDPKTNNALQKKQLSLSPNPIPIVFCGDIIRGVRTMFPIPLGEAASWDPEIARKCAEAIAKEGNAVGGRWTFAPMADIARDARWGRNVEGAGEDPYLASLFAQGRVQGFQGNPEKIDSDHLAATIKHFAGYSLLEGGEEYERVYASEHELEEFAFPPYEAGIQAGVSAVMAAFNDLNGVPCSGNHTLLKDTLRGKMGFEGVTVSDYAAIAQMVNQHYCQDGKDATYEAFSAGIDIDMESRLYIAYLKDLIQEGKISMRQLDAAVLRILKFKNKLGLFENPYVDENREEKEILTPETRALAKASALRSAVLLQNDGTLPLGQESRLGAYGPLLDNPRDQNGPWSYDDTLDASITYLRGLKSAFPSLQVLKEPAEASPCDTILYLAGLNRDESGEAASKTDLRLPEKQREEIKQLRDLGKKIVLVVTSARPLALQEEMGECAAILWMWTPGTEGGAALADLLSGREEPTGHTAITFPRTGAQCPLYYNRPDNGRPHNPEDHYTTGWLDCPYSPLVPFGFGLYYHPTVLEGLSLDRSSYGLHENIAVAFLAKNLSGHKVRRLAQIYATKDFSKPTRPGRELVGFAWIELLPNETKKAEISIPALRLAKNPLGKGDYDLSLAENSSAVIAKAHLTIKG
jgi:beta-glucosidase